MRYLLLTAYFIFLPAMAMAEISIEVLDYGLYHTKLEQERTHTAASSDVLPPQGRAELLKQTKDIPLQRNIEFGYHFSLSGTKDNCPLTFTLNHPPMVTPSGKVTRTNSFNQTVSPGDPNYDGFSFEFDWELIPGEYIFEIQHKNRTLSKVLFNVLEQ